MVSMTTSPLRKSAAAVTILMAVAAAAGCQASGEVAAVRPQVTTATPSLRSHLIGAATWTDGPWPFTVAQGQLECKDEGHVQIQTFTANGVTYSLNRAAKDADRYPPVDSIWRQDPSLPGFKVDIAEVIEYASKLCPFDGGRVGLGIHPSGRQL
jgi:hypothetical protein